MLDNMAVKNCRSGVIIFKRNEHNHTAPHLWNVDSVFPPLMPPLLIAPATLLAVIHGEIKPPATPTEDALINSLQLNSLPFISSPPPIRITKIVRARDYCGQEWE
jgi:hypothetical protein